MADENVDSLNMLFDDKSMFIHHTAILLNDIDLVAAVGGHEVVSG